MNKKSKWFGGVAYACFKHSSISTDFYVNQLGFTLRRSPQTSKDGYTHALFKLGNSPRVRLGSCYDNPGCGKYFDLYDPDGHVIKVCQGWN